jgi:hypothetical protein
MRTRLIVALMSVLLIIAGCAAESDSTPSESAGPYDPSATIRPELMELEPATPAPDEVLSVRFPQETQRGVAFVLEEDTASDWDLRYFLVAGSESEGAAEWWTPDEAEGRGWDDVGVDGPGPDFVEVPATAPPGDYRLCTANAVENLCAPLKITE